VRNWLLRKSDQINDRMRLSIALCDAIETVPPNRRSGALWWIGFSELAILVGLIFTGRAIDLLTSRSPAP
jgi:hypothetical protein